MLVLTRKSGQAIRIGESVTVTVVQLGRGRVRLGIDAPGAVSVHRGEIYDRIHETSSASSIPETNMGKRASVEIPIGDEALHS